MPQPRSEITLRDGALMIQSGRHSAMIKQSPDHSRRGLWRFIFLLLVVIPFLPEMVILVTAGVAEIMGWDQKGACTSWSLPVTNIINRSLELGTGLFLAGVGTPATRRMVLYAGVAAWLWLCLIVVSLGWTTARSRLLLGFATAIVFAVLPYFGSMWAIELLPNDHCGAVGSCVMFGGYVWYRERAVAMGWLADPGVPLALGIFAICAIVVIVFGVRSGKRARAAGR